VDQALLNMSSAAKPVVLPSADWSPSSKVNERGGKAINIISTHTNDNGESGGKFSISLNFPNDDLPFIYFFNTLYSVIIGR
jgi:hypothetical protein